MNPVHVASGCESFACHMNHDRVRNKKGTRTLSLLLLHLRLLLLPTREQDSY